MPPEPRSTPSSSLPPQGAVAATRGRGNRGLDPRTDADSWVLPWAILPEVDYLLGEHVGARAQELFAGDLASGAWAIEWGDPADLVRAEEISRRHQALRLGLVDSVVMAVAERRSAEAIATLDLRHFGAVTLRGRPRLVPRDID